MRSIAPARCSTMAPLKGKSVFSREKRERNTNAGVVCGLTRVVVVASSSWSWSSFRSGEGRRGCRRPRLSALCCSCSSHHLLTLFGKVSVLHPPAEKLTYFILVPATP